MWGGHQRNAKDERAQTKHGPLLLGGHLLTKSSQGRAEWSSDIMVDACDGLVSHLASRTDRLRTSLRRIDTMRLTTRLAMGVTLGLTLPLVACSGEGEINYEGDEAGECDDGADNDQDGAYDCDDPGCAASPLCGGGASSGADDYEGDGPGECTDQADNDRDGAFDCDDEGCQNSPACADGSTSSPVSEDAGGTSEPSASEDTDAQDLDGQGDVPEQELPWDEDVGPDGDEDAFEVFVPDDEAFIHVAIEGVDDSGCGDSKANSCGSLAYGLELLAGSGGTLLVHAGTYIENELMVPSGVNVVSADGPLQAKVYSNDKSAFRFWQVEQAGLDGFEIYGDWNDGEAADALVRVFDASQITLKNAIIRDAPKSADVVQVTGACSGVTLENLILLNPGKQNQGSYQQLLEVFGSKGLDDGTLSISDLTIRGCWFMQHYDTGGDDLMYMRASVGEVLIENNVFGPGNGPGGANRPAVQIGTQHGPQPKNTFPETRDVVIRNNIFAGLRGDAALGVSNSEWAWIYNNVFYANSGSKTRSVIMLRGNKYTPNNIHVVNNVFDSNMPTKNGGDLYWLRDTLMPEAFQHDYNHYSDNVLSSSVDYLGEVHGQYDLPAGFDNPQVPPGFSVPSSLGALEAVRAGYLVTEEASVVNAGIDAVGIDYHPAYSQSVVRRWDVIGEPRPIAGQWDIGIHEPLP